MKMLLLTMVVVCGLVMFLTGCSTYGENTDMSIAEHSKFHFRAPYRQLVELHREIDYFIFNIDETDPDLYPPYLWRQ